MNDTRLNEDNLEERLTRWGKQVPPPTTVVPLTAADLQRRAETQTKLFQRNLSASFVALIVLSITLLPLVTRSQSVAKIAQIDAGNSAIGEPSPTITPPSDGTLTPPTPSSPRSYGEFAHRELSEKVSDYVSTAELRRAWIEVKQLEVRTRILNEWLAANP